MKCPYFLFNEVLLPSSEDLRSGRRKRPSLPSPTLAPPKLPECRTYNMLHEFANSMIQQSKGNRYNA